MENLLEQTLYSLVEGVPKLEINVDVGQTSTINFLVYNFKAEYSQMTTKDYNMSSLYFDHLLNMFINWPVLCL